jgi:hypothetical protein
VKRILLFGLIVTMSAICIALIGANTASTTALCEDEPKEGLCQKEATFFSAGISKFETPVGTVSCGTFVEAYGVEPATPKGKPLEGEMSFQFPSCSNGAELCWVPFESEGLWSSASFNWTSGANGTVELTGNGEGFEVEIVCQTKINCTYTLESELDVVGGKKGSIVASKEKMGSATGSTCPGSGAAISFSASYASGPFFVGSAIPPVTLCKKSESPCSAAESYGIPTSLSAGLETGSTAKLKLKITEESKTTEYTVACSASTLEGKATAAGWPTKAEMSSAVFGECGGTCAVEAVKPPFTGEIEASGGGNGKLTLSPRLRVKCIGAYKCTYEASGLGNTITGGAPAKVQIGMVLNKLVSGESDAKCGAEMTWEGVYRFTKPEAGGEAKMWVEREGI